MFLIFTCMIELNLNVNFHDDKSGTFSAYTHYSFWIMKNSRYFRPCPGKNTWILFVTFFFHTKWVVFFSKSCQVSFFFSNIFDHNRKILPWLIKKQEKLCKKIKDLEFAKTCQTDWCHSRVCVVYYGFHQVWYQGGMRTTGSGVSSWGP